MYQQQSSSSYAEIGFSKTCFGLKPRHKSTVCVLNEADAAVRVQDETALLWVDISKETIFLTERWGSDTVCHKLPAKISVKKEAPSKANHEVPVTSLSFSERSSAEHYGKLALNLLPEWLSIRRSTTAKSLLVLTDHWIVTEAEQALKLQHPAGHLQVLLRLDVGQACIQAVLIQESGSCKAYQVSCLGDVTKLLRKHSKPQERLEKVVHSVLQELKPSASSVGRLLARLEAAAMGHKGVPSIAQWCRGGVMAALVDTAAALGRTSGRNERSKGGHRHSTPGCSDQSIQQQSRSASMPGAAPVQAACDSTADLATLQALAECCCVMMQYGTPAGEQADLLAACVSRALMGSFAEAVCALQLLHMVLRHLGPLSKSPACVQLRKACCHPQLLQQLEHCFSRAVAPQQQQQQQLKSTDEQHLLLSHQLEGLSPDGASEPTTPIGGQHGLQEQASGVSAELGSLSDSPTTTPRSPAGFFLRRRSLVPKLHLPVPVTPAPNSCSRLSVQSTAQAVHNNTSTSFSSTDKGAGSEQKVAAPSYLRALQQLGRSCGQSVMAADLAAFVTHKQLLGGVVAQEATLQHSRHASISTQQDVSSCHMPANGQIGFDQLSELPVQARLHVMLLEILSLMADMPGSELVLPKPWEHLLMSPLLSFKSTWLHCGGGAGAGRERTLLERAYSRVRALTLQLVQHSSRLRHMCLSAGSSTAANAGLSTSSVARLHQSVLEQFKARLAACSMEGRAVTAGTHSDCAELLLLLRDYLLMSLQPQLADTACFIMGGVLAQQEHMLRATRMEHWPLQAVVHMDALIQLYTQLLGQVSSPAAAAWLLAVLGVQASEERSGCGAAAAISSSPHASTPVPADTLQLLLDYLQTHLAALAAAADGHGAAAQRAEETAATPVSACPMSAQNVPSSRVNSKRAADGASGCSTNSLHGLLLPSVSAVQQVHTTHGSADVFVMQLRANCWTLLNRLLLLAHRQPTSRAHEVFGSPLYPKAANSSHRDGLQRPLEHRGDVTPGSQRTLVQASPPKGMPQSSLSARCAAAAAAQQPSEEPAVPPAQNMRPSLPLLSTPNSCSTSSTPSAHRGSNDSVSLSSASRTPSGLLAAQCRPGGFPSGCCSIWQVLIELLMVNSSMGQATALQHMAETNGNRLLLPLQRAVTEFLSTALGTPDSYAFTKPQLAEFYVHHHFLHFTQNYHKLPTSSASAALCKSHLQVLLALCRHTGGAHQVRRRFLQLKVLEFIVREASLEYMYLHNQLAASPTSSSCSTPLSTSRTAVSYRTAQDTTGPAGGAAAAAGTPTGMAAFELANGGSAGLGPSWELSSANGRGASSSRLWVSSPGCHLSARSAQHTQRSGSSRGLRSGAEVAARREQQASGMGSVPAASVPLQSYAVEGLCNDMGELLLTGSSGLLTGTSSLPAGWSAADAGPSNSSRAGAAGSQPGRQPSIKLGSKVKAAVEALESAAAAVGQQPLLQPQPPASACPPAAAAGRRQPGQQRLVGVGEPGQAACSPQVPKLKLPTSCPAADVNPASGSRQSPNGGIVAWQQLEPPLEAAAADDDGGSGASPRADIAGYEVPASTRSQRRIKQPKLTGDASLDNIIIDSWERRTGLEYQFDDFGADVDAAGSSLRSSSSSQGKACQESLPSSPQRADVTVQSAAGIKSALRPQTPGLASLVALGSSAGHDQIWALPHFDLGPVPGSSRWISSSDTVEDAAPVSVTQILREGHKHSTGRDVSNSTPADRLNGAAAAAAASIGPGKVQIPRLCMGGLQSAQMPLGDSSRAMSTPHSPCSTGASSCRECEDVAASPGSYKPGFDLEEDFERLMAAGDWDDSDSDAGSEQSTQPGADADARSPPSPHPGAYAAAQAPQNRLQNGSQLLLRAPHPPCEPCRQQQQDPASLEHGCSSPDVQAAADVHSSKGKAQKRGKKQAVVAGSNAPVVAELSAHALADVSGSSSGGSQCAGTSSDSEVDSDSCSDVPGPWPVGPSPTHTPAVVIPRLNLPQLQQPSWHLPMADTALLTGESSEAALSSSYRTSITSASRGTPLTVVPLTTGRLTGGAADSSRGRSTNTAGPGPNSSQQSGRFGSSARGQTRLSHLLEPCADAGQAEGAPCTPSTTAAVGPSSGPYAAHRAKCAVYMDLELHALCMELALHLLVTPNGQLDPVQLPHEPTDVSLQRKVMLLLEHLSHPANLGMACALAQRACSILRQQQQDPGAMLSSSGQPAASEQPSSRAGALDSMVLGSAHSGGSSAASQQDLQEALRAVWHDEAYQLVRAGRTASGSAGSEGGSGLASTADLAADAAAGLAVSSLRLLKLLCAPVLDTRRLDVGGMINKGAFSEIMAGMYYAPDGSAPIAVALKVMDCSQDDACSFERVYNEVVSLEVLHGKPHVVPLLEYGVTSNISGTRQWVLVFPRYASSMREWRTKWAGKGLNTQDLPVYLSLFLQVAHAVAVLHSSNVVHFDIKGDNVLLQHGFNPASLDQPSSSSRPSADIVLADFGDALMLENAHASSQRHRGTELFSSPEMLLLHAGRQHAHHAQHDRRKHRGVHAAHDVWSLGCTLYELLTGSVLFEDEGVGRITSYSSSQSSGGGAHSLRPDARGWGVLNAREKAALQHHTGCIELVESMLVGEPNWRPTAEQVVHKTQRLLASLHL